MAQSKWVCIIHDEIWYFFKLEMERTGEERDQAKKVL